MKCNCRGYWIYHLPRAFGRFSLVWLLLFSTGCSAFDIVNALTPPCGYQRSSNISYGNLPRQKLDVFKPVGAKSAGIVVFFYGGSWSSGQKGDYAFVGQALASRGFVAVLPDYRLYPAVRFPAFVQDAALAVRWVHDHAAEIGGDPTHIYLMGHSAGAHIAALVTVDERYLKAVGLGRSDIRATVGLAGPYDFKIGLKLRPVFNLHSATQPIDPNIEPINLIDGNEAPMLLIQGTDDHTVDPSNTTQLADRIRQAGGKVDVIFYAHRGHRSLVQALAFPFRWLAPVLNDTTKFFHTH